MPSGAFIPKHTPVVFTSGLIGCLDHSTLHKRLSPLPVFVPDLLGYGRLSGVTPCNVNIPSQIEHLHREIGKHAQVGEYTWSVTPWAEL